MTRREQAFLVGYALFVLTIAGCGDKPAAPANQASGDSDKVISAPAAVEAAPPSAQPATTEAKPIAQPDAVQPDPVAAAPNADESAASKPLDPAAAKPADVAGARPADGPNSDPVQPEILAAIEAARKEELGVYVRFEDRDEKQIVALINAGVTKEPRTNWTKEVKLGEGRGIPLKEVQSPLKFVIPPAERRAIAEEVEERDGWRLRKLNLRDQENKPTTAYRHLWSSDGRRLYLLTGGLGFVVVDADRWEILFEPDPERGTAAYMAWSSAGLVVLHAGDERRDPSGPTPWNELEGAADAGPSKTHYGLLSVYDPETMELRKCWQVRGSRVAGRPDSPIIYVSQSAPNEAYSRILVIDAQRGELLNAIEGSALRPQEDLLMAAAQGEFFNKPPEGVVIDGPAISPDGKWLLNVPEPHSHSLSPRSSLCRLQIDGVRLRCQQRLADLGAAHRTPSPDGRFLSISDPRGSGYGLLELTDFSHYLGAMAWEKYGGPFAVDFDSKTIYIAAWSGDFGNQVVLKAVHNGKPSVIPVNTKIDPLMEFPLSPEEAVVDLDVRPNHPGLLVLGKAGNYWIEGGKPADTWPFEREVAPESKPPDPALKAEIAAKPLEPDRTSSPRVKLKADWLRWTPDGTAFLVVSGETIYRFDGATDRETHRLHVGRFGRLITTSAALAVSDAADQAVTLIRYETLEPLRQIAPLARFSGNAAHPRIVGYNNGAVVMFDVEREKVVAQVLQEQLNHRWPRDRRTDRAILTSWVDADRVFLHRDRLAILRVRGDQLEIERIWEGPSLDYNQEYSLSPAGNMCRYDLGIYSLDEGFKRIENSRLFMHFGDDGKAYFLGNSSVAAVEASGKTAGIATLRHEVSQAIPHPTDVNRLLIWDGRAGFVYDESVAWRDQSGKIISGREPPPPVVIPREVLEAQRVAQLTKNLQKLATSYVAFTEKNGKPPLKWADIDDADARSLELHYDVFFNLMPQEMTIGLEDVILAYPRNASTKGGLVVAADGTTRTVTANVFNKLIEEQLADLAKAPRIRKMLAERGTKASQAKANQPLREMLVAFRDAYFSFSDLNSGHGPPGWEEFEKKVDAAKGLKEKFAALGYELVPKLGPGDLPRGGGSFKYIIAYPKNGPQQGGFVVFHDGAIKELTAAEFNETASQQAKLLKKRPQP